MADESNLITLDQLKQALDPAPQGSTSDAALTAYIKRASNLISTLSQLVITPETEFTDVYRIDGGGGIITLRRRPVTAVLSVSISGTAITELPIDASDLDTDRQWRLDPDFNNLHIYVGSIGTYDDTYFNRRFMIPENAVVTYQAGVPVGSILLGMLEHACVVTCALWWKRRPHIDQSSMAAPNGLGTVTFTKADLPDDAWTIIEQLKRPAPAL